MTGLDPEFDRLLGSLRANDAPPASPTLRESVLEAFDREHRLESRVHRPWRGGKRPGVAVALLAAALLAAATFVLVAGSERLGGRERRIDRGSEQLVALVERADVLERRIAEFEARQAASSTPELGAVAPGSIAEKLLPTYVASGCDPGLLRLVAASRVELVDPVAARARYRELATEFAASPAAEIARQRLLRLGE
jgi:hypothetical protein